MVQPTSRHPRNKLKLYSVRLSSKKRLFLPKTEIFFEMPLKSTSTFWDHYDEIKAFIRDYSQACSRASRSYTPEDLPDENAILSETQEELFELLCEIQSPSDVTASKLTTSLMVFPVVTPHLIFLDNLVKKKIFSFIFND